MELIYILISVAVVGLISLAGVSTLVFNQKSITRLMPWLVSFAAGTLLGVSFFDLLPETIELLPDRFSAFVVVGILAFLVFEQVLHWHHTHDDNCADHQHVSTGYSVLLGDSIHNFLDGVLIASAYITSPALGLTTTVAVILHEIPQEFSDFAVLLHSGFSVKRALWLNFVSATTAIAGAVVGYFALTRIELAIPYALAIGTGGLLYISLVDLFSEVKGGRSLIDRMLRILAVVAGLGLMWLVASRFHA